MPQLKYMPLPKSQQLIQPLECDGALLLVEMSDEVFVPGAKRWKEVVDVMEHKRIMQFFMFVLSVCIETLSEVCLELVVSEEFDTLHKKKISNAIRIIGYRLWIPLKWSQEVDTFGRGVTMTFSSATDQNVMQNGKRRKVVQVDDRPIFVRRVNSIHGLVKLLKAYNGGKGNITGIQPVGLEQTSAGIGEVESDGKMPRFTDYLDARRYFLSDNFEKRRQQIKHFHPQTELKNYLNDRDQFFPCADIRTTGILRHFKCGPGGFIENDPIELMSYMLPHYLISLDEVRSKIEQVNAAIGLHDDLSSHTLDDLILAAGEENVDCFSDPHDYAEVTVEEEDLVDGDVGLSTFRRIIASNYHILTTLSHSNRLRFDFHSRNKDARSMRQFMGRLVGDIRLMMMGKTTEGVPKVYCRLYRENLRLMAQVNRNEKKDDYVLRAQKMFYARKKDHYFTGISWSFVRDFLGARSCMKLMLQQQAVYILLYNLSFGVTMHNVETSSVIILAGPSDTGKSWAMKLFTSSIANSITRTEDSSSAQVGTVDDSADLMIVVQDEFKGASDFNESNSERTKTEQSRISNGVTIRRRWTRNATTNKSEIETAIGIERSCFVCGTNMPHQIPLAMQSRSTIVPVVLGNSRKHQNGMVADRLGNGVAAAIYNDPVVQRDLQAWQLSQKLLSTCQVHYTVLEAVGGIPPLREDLFQIFKLIRIDRFGKGETSRETTDLLRLATSIHIRDHVAMWYSRGLGEHFKFDKAVEALWYAWSNYLRMEEIVLATVQLESSRSMRGYMEDVMVLLKESILIQNNQMYEFGDYWITKYMKRQSLIRDLKLRLVRIGEGLCSRIIEMVERMSILNAPVTKYDTPVDRSCEYMMVHKSWISKVWAPVDVAVIQVLRRVAHEGILVHRDFETEKKIIFDTQIRKSLRNPEGKEAIKFGELEHFSSDAIRMSFHHLLNRVDGNTRLVETPNDTVSGAVYQVDEPRFENREVFRAIDGTRWKIKKNIYAPLVVHESVLLQKDDIRLETEMDTFFKDMLIISGGYIGKRIFSGVDTVSPANSLLECSYEVKEEDTVKISVRNPHRQHEGDRGILFGDDGEESNDKTIFPADKDILHFTECSHLEKCVANLARSRVPLEGDIRDVFEKAYEMYK